MPAEVQDVADALSVSEKEDYYRISALSKLQGEKCKLSLIKIICLLFTICAIPTSSWAETFRLECRRIYVDTTPFFHYTHADLWHPTNFSIEVHDDIAHYSVGLDGRVGHDEWDRYEFDFSVISPNNNATRWDMTILYIPSTHRYMKRIVAPAPYVQGSGSQGVCERIEG
ncbi:hypothetical protein RYZ18_00005 [Roseovarius sp. 10]|uniref:hypothetical protein n=1 Tax=Roseovarius sp. 10 TaxID=3080563 RepID=UPI0029542899|nr:hypothetical protein [Roseovarius sp. 10]MDV7199702.1 hypothetical protein [Roseovarius sp. 10]